MVLLQDAVYEGSGSWNGKREVLDFKRVKECGRCIEFLPLVLPYLVCILCGEGKK
jgi:hypothetical protein